MVCLVFGTCVRISRLYLNVGSKVLDTSSANRLLRGSKMGWNKGKAWFSVMCHECGKKFEGGETCYIES